MALKTLEPNPAPLLRMLDELGRITDEPGRLTRTFLSPAMRRANAKVAEWMCEAGLAVQQIAELLPVTGAQYVGPFPEELQLYTVFSAGVGAASKDRQAAKAFIGAITTPAAIALFRAAGLESIG